MGPQPALRGDDEDGRVAVGEAKQAGTLVVQRTVVVEHSGGAQSSPMTSARDAISRRMLDP